uniref:Uncharacterized protein n=1 Tax=Manihot esculenta TaxID=3983 RepID=A0A2C9V2D1_MANES
MLRPTPLPRPSTSKSSLHSVHTLQDKENPHKFFLFLCFLFIHVNC